jgi:hypothetical protein
MIAPRTDLELVLALYPEILRGTDAVLKELRMVGFVVFIHFVHPKLFEKAGVLLSRPAFSSILALQTTFRFLFLFEFALASK